MKEGLAMTSPVTQQIGRRGEQKPRMKIISPNFNLYYYYYY
jgi:hypothetical protein